MPSGLAFAKHGWHLPSLSLFHHTHIRRSDYLAVSYKLLKSVRTPSCYTRHCKYRREQLSRNIQHVIYKSAVEIHIGADSLEYLALLGYELRSHGFNLAVELHVALLALRLGLLLDKALKHTFSRVRE